MKETTSAVEENVADKLPGIYGFGSLAGALTEMPRGILIAKVRARTSVWTGSGLSLDVAFTRVFAQLAPICISKLDTF